MREAYNNIIAYIVIVFWPFIALHLFGAKKKMSAPSLGPQIDFSTEIG